MSDLGFELEEIARLIKLVEQRGLSELIVEDGDRRVVIRGEGYRRPHRAQAMAAEATAPAEHGLAHSGVETPRVEADVPVLSPMVGIFYRSPGPDTAPYVDVGDHVEVGQIIGMIEAMKVFSEVPSDHAGKITRIVPENGELVKANDPILYLIPD